MAFETFCLVGIPPGIRVSPSVFWFLYLTTLSRLLLAVTITSRPRLPIPRRRYRDIQVSLLVFRILSSTPLPGFIGPESSVLSVNLPPSGPLPASGSPHQVWFSNASHSLQRQARRASLGKTHRLPVSRPTSLRFGSPDIRPRSSTPARPPPRCHIVGSLFATYTGSASCFLQTAHF